MKKILNLVLAVILMLTMCVSFMGCGKPDPSTLVVWWTPGEARKTEVEKAIARFEDVNPGVTVRLKPQATSDYRDQLKKILKADPKNAPDIIVTDHSVIQSLGVSGRLLDLAPLGANDEKDKFFATNWEANTYMDKVYGMPLDANCVALMYNKAILKDSGVTEVIDGQTVARPPKTYEEFLNACDKIKAKGYIPFAFPVVDQSSFSPYMFTAWMARNGADIMSDDLSSSVVNSDKGKDTMEKIRNLVTKGYITTSWEVNKFFRGEIAMIEMGSWELTQITTDNIEVTEMFTIDPEIPNYSCLGLYSLAMTNKCVNQQKGYELIKFLTTDETFVKDYNKTINLFPSLKSLLDDDAFKGRYLDAYNTQIRKTVSRPGSPAWEISQRYIMDAVENVGLSLDRTVADIMDELKTKMDREINK